METINIPVSVTPFCASISTPLLFDRASDAPQLIEVPPDQERLADDVLLRHEAPVPAVVAAVPIVAHHEVVTRRHLADEAVFIVGTIFPVGKHAGSRNRERAGVGFYEDRMLVIVQLFEIALGRNEAHSAVDVVEVAR